MKQTGITQQQFIILLAVIAGVVLLAFRDILDGLLALWPAAWLLRRVMKWDEGED